MYSQYGESRGTFQQPFHSIEIAAVNREFVSLSVYLTKISRFVSGGQKLIGIIYKLIKLLISLYKLQYSRK